jgi:DNA-binding XRE family transcriptional regulator
MFKNDTEYQMALTRIKTDEQVAANQRSQLQQMGLSAEDIELAMQPLLSFHAQLIDEVRWYESIMQNDFTSLENIDALGRLLIAVRLAHRISQEELARRLHISLEEVVHNERDEYYGFTLDELLPVIDALGARISTRVEFDPEPERQLAYAD